MKNTFGNSVSVTLFGESHQAVIGATLDGLAPGIPIDEDFIRFQMQKRKPADGLGTTRRESDELRIVSGVFHGKTTGTPLTVLIENNDVADKDYDDLRYLPRPGHADFAAYEKYHGFEDYRGGGHFSGRITAPLTAIGAIALYALKQKGIEIGTHIQILGGIEDREITDASDILQLNTKHFPVLENAAAERMKVLIAETYQNNDSVGGITQTAVYGIPAGIGEPWFDTVEGLISHAVFSVPGIKGIVFGDAYRLENCRGQSFNDEFLLKSGVIKTATNHNGGINGGITNGMPIVFRCNVKPTPSIAKQQKTVNMRTRTPTQIEIHGRHDPAFIARVGVVVDSITALTLCDLLALRYGTDWLGGS